LLFRDVVHHSGITEKVDNFTAESVANFDRNGWTTSNGTGGQHQTEWPDNIDRNTHSDEDEDNPVLPGARRFGSVHVSRVRPGANPQFLRRQKSVAAL
jgi:hypothetical protein